MGGCSFAFCFVVILVVVVVLLFLLLLFLRGTRASSISRRCGSCVKSSKRCFVCSFCCWKMMDSFLLFNTSPGVGEVISEGKA